MVNDGNGLCMTHSGTNCKNGRKRAFRKEIWPQIDVQLAGRAINPAIMGIGSQARRSRLGAVSCFANMDASGPRTMPSSFSSSKIGSRQVRPLFFSQYTNCCRDHRLTAIGMHSTNKQDGKAHCQRRSSFVEL